MRQGVIDAMYRLYGPLKLDMKEIMVNSHNSLQRRFNHRMALICGQSPVQLLFENPNPIVMSPALYEMILDSDPELKDLDQRITKLRQRPPGGILGL